MRYTKYEKQIEEKGRQLKEDIVPTSYRASKEDDDLKKFISAGWMEATSIVEISKCQIHQCVDEGCKRKVNGVQLYLIDQATRGGSMHVHMVDEEDRVWTL